MAGNEILHRVTSALFGRLRQSQEGLSVDGGLVLDSSFEPLPVTDALPVAPPLSQRQQKLEWYATTHPVADTPVSGLEGVETEAPVVPMGVSDVLQRDVRTIEPESPPIVRPLKSTPRFRREFENLSAVARVEVSESIEAAKRGTGVFEPLHDVPHGLRLFKSHSHRGSGDHFRILLVEQEAIPGSFYAVTIYPRQHDYNPHDIRAIARSIRISIPEWEVNGKMQVL